MLLLMMTTESATKVTPGQSECLEGLLADVATGNMQALETFYTNTKTSVYGFALSLLKNRQNAEDVMQETYVKVFQNAGAYRPMGKPMAWVLTIVRNLALMKLRADKDFVSQPEEELVAVDLGDSVQTAIDRMVLHTALCVLGEEERQIVILHSVTGLKHREIAEILQIPLSTTLSKYRRALGKLQKQIKEEAK